MPEHGQGDRQGKGNGGAVRQSGRHGGDAGWWACRRD